MSRSVAAKVRAAYETRPYPAVTKQKLRRPPWRLPPPDWIRAVAPQAKTPPQRILVAGCGTGLEAFALRRRFPNAEIVGVDFAVRSIEVARRLQKSSARWRDVRFVRADLTSHGLADVTGGAFDFISCHGVLSYLPHPVRALRNLTRCLAPAGLVYLGVNGAAHFSVNWRRFLSAFGFEMEQWTGGERVWKHLRLAASVAGDTQGQVFLQGPGYLASDLFGPLLHNLPLSEWVRMGQRAGLHLRGSHSAQRLLWPALNDGSAALFFPRLRAEVAQILELLWPSGFHRLIFTLEPEPVPPWQRPAALRQWHPLLATSPERFRWPRGGGVRVLKVRNASTNTSIELRAAPWEIELLRGSDGKRPLHEVLAEGRGSVTPAALKSSLYLFYQLDLLNLSPPPAPSQAV